MIGPDWFWNNNGNYNFISGPLPDITLLTGLAIWLRRHNCHVHGCWRLQWHPHPVHGHPVCRKHHPHSQSAKLDASAHPRAVKRTRQDRAAERKRRETAHPG